MHFNIILLSKSGYSKWQLPFEAPDQGVLTSILSISHFYHACYRSRQIRPLSFGHVGNIRSEYNREIPHPYPLAANIFLSALLQHTIIACSVLTVRD
jgi:hypothetical protein